MTSRKLTYLLVIASSMMVAQSAMAINVYWKDNDGVAPTNPGVWSTNATDENFINGASVNVPYTDGDAVFFADADGGVVPGGGVPYPGFGPVAISISGTVTPASVTVNRGYGTTYTFTGGDIAGTGAFNITRDQTVVFQQNSLSFSGGTNFYNSGFAGALIRFTPSTTGNVNFGTGSINFNLPGAAVFSFEPTVAGAVLTNNIVVNTTGVGDNPISFNANAAFSGTLTINSANVRLGAGGAAPSGYSIPLATYPIATINATTDFAVDVTSIDNPSLSPPRLNSNISAPGKVLTLLHGNNGTNPDWQVNVDAAVAWDVQGITKTGRSGLNLLDANIGKYLGSGDTLRLQGGTVRFGGVATPNTTPNIDFRIVMDPAANQVGVNAFESGAGFRNVTSLNILSGGVLSSKGLQGVIAGDNNLDISSGGSANVNTRGDFESSIDITVQSGGRIEPGESVGLLGLLGTATFNSGSILAIDITGANDVAGVDFDQFNVSSTVTGVGNLNLIVSVAGLTNGDLAGDVFRILTTSSNLTGSNFQSVQVQGGYRVNTVTYGNGFIELSDVRIVPEPGALGLISLAALALVRLRRKSG